MSATTSLTLEVDKAYAPETDGEPFLAYPWSTSEVKPFAWHKRRQRAFDRMKNFSWLDWLGVILPCTVWLRRYNIRKHLLLDIIAGLAVGFMVIPQAMSYANTAGLPSVFGLYSAFSPVLAYSLFGGCRQLGVGPVAVTSSMLSSSLDGIVANISMVTNPNTPGEYADVQANYNMAAIQVALLASFMYIVIGFLQMGFLTNFLSHSVIGGFTSGAAVYIGSGQLKYILGYSSLSQPANQRVQTIYSSLLNEFDNFMWQEFVMGITMMIWLVTLKELSKAFPKRLFFLKPLAPISACIISIAAVAIGGLSSKGIKIVSSIPSGAPSVTVNLWFPMDFSTLIIPAFLIMLVGGLESTSIARALAHKNGYEINWNQEIVALGITNFAGACFSAYPTTGSFSRSSVNNTTGAKTQLAGFITSMVVLFAILFLTSVFEKLPYNTMAAIVISAVSDLFEYEQAIYLYKVNKLDFLVWWASFFGTIFYSVELGLGIAIGMAILITIYESAFPNTAVLGKIPGTSVYRNRKQYREAQITPGILAVRVDASIYFANINWIRQRVDKYLYKATELYEQQGMKIQFFILDATPVTHIDATGAHALEDMILDLARRDIQFVLVNPSPKVLAALERAAVTEMFGREWIFVRTHDAFSYCKTQLRGRVQITPSATEVTLTLELDSKPPESA